MDENRSNGCFCTIVLHTTKITLYPDARHSSSFSDRPILQPISDTAEFNLTAMKIMLFLILVSLLLAAGFLLAYLRAARDGQFDDDYTPAIRMLFDDPIPGASLSDEAVEKDVKQQDEDLKPSL